MDMTVVYNTLTDSNNTLPIIAVLIHLLAMGVLIDANITTKRFLWIIVPIDIVMLLVLFYVGLQGG